MAIMRRDGLRQGWAIDASHPAQMVINANNILEHLRTLPDNPPPSRWARDLFSYVQTHTSKILTHPELLNEPPRVLKHVLRQDCLMVSEDDVLHAVKAYAKEYGGNANSAEHSRAGEREKYALECLLPFVRILSVSTKVFVREMEPLRMLSESQLISKYKHDALARAGDSHVGKSRYRPNNLSIRGSVIVAESTHPYHVGHDEMLQEVRTFPAGCRTLIEFDRRCFIGDGATLTFYADSEATVVLGRWRDMWRGRGRPIRVWVIDSCRFWVGLRCAFDGIACWGWKLVATPLLSEEE
ncbi:hypothetical protein FGB62_178g043 [Gracilaria domingensis]|nr:hypothetical protein FGB62_178g043 [Gracilaria domingensis]